MAYWLIVWKNNLNKARPKPNDVPVVSLIQKQPNQAIHLTLFQLRGAILAPDSLKQSLISTVLCLVTKIHDFVHLRIPLIPVKLILKKRNNKFQKIEKRKFAILTPKGPLEKNQEKFKNLFFSKIHTFSAWIWILHVLSFLLSYMK